MLPRRDSSSSLNLQEPLAPVSLITLQQLFSGQIISSSPVFDHKFLVKSQNLSIYRDNFWRKMTQALATSFPRLKSLHDDYFFFHEFVSPYLAQHPPASFDISSVGKHLPQWILCIYQKKLKKESYEAALFDAAALKLSRQRRLPHLTLQDFGQPGFENKPLKLQPTTALLAFKYDVTELSLKSQPTFLIMQLQNSSRISWQKISKLEYLFLSKLEQGVTVTEICEFGNQYISRHDITFNLEKELLEWLKKWIINGLVIAL